MSSGCDCKEVYRFPHITYPYSSCICYFLQQHRSLLFVHFLCFSLEEELEEERRRIKSQFFTSSGT